MATTFARMQQRRDTTANWTTANPVLREGEWGLDLDEQRFKVGDGVTAWADLNFLLDAEVAAAVAAAAAAEAAQSAVEAVVATNDGIMTAVAEDEDSDFNAALSATIGDAVTEARQGNGFVPLGDSISTSLTSGNGGAGYGQAWSHMLPALAQQRINLLGQAGVAGNTAAQILARVPDVIAMHPQVVTLLAGHNDLHQGTSFATWSANVAAAAEQLRAAGIRVFLCTLLPRANTTYLTTTLAWNRWLKAYAQQNRYDLLDFFAVTADPTTGEFKAGFEAIDSGDEIHPSGRGHIAMAQYAAPLVQTPAYEPIRALLNTEAGNMQANALLAVGSPTPDYFIPQGTGGMTGLTEGLVTDPDFLGKAWEWEFVNPSTGVRQLTSYQISTGFTAGDVLLFSLRVKIPVSDVEPATGAGLNVQALWTGATPAYQDVILGDAVEHESALIQFRLPVPAGTTAIQINSYVNLVGATDSFTCLVGEFGIFNLTTGALL